MELSKKQTIAVDYLEDNKTNEVLFGGSAGGGKSILGVYWLIKQCIKYPHTRWLMGRAKLKTLKETTLQSFFKVCQMQGLKPFDHYKYNQQAGTITFFNGSEILLKDLFFYPSDPNFDELGSLELTGAFIDEANQIVSKAKQIVRSRIRHDLEVNGLIPKMLMSCNPAKNWTYSEFFKPSRDGTIPDNKVFIQSLVTDNPNIEPSYIENLKQLDTASKERLLFGNWDYDADPSKLLTIDQINDLFTNTHVKGGTRYITADIALEGSDSFVITCWNGWIVDEIHVIQRSNGKEVIDELNRLKDLYRIPNSRIVYDKDGVGGFISGFLKGAKGFVNNSTPKKQKGRVQQFNNLATQCGYLFCEKVRNAEIYISDPRNKEKIIEELEQIKNHNFGTDEKIKIDKKKIKEMINRSPDFFDSLKMRMYFELFSFSMGAYQ